MRAGFSKGGTPLLAAMLLDATVALAALRP